MSWGFKRKAVRLNAAQERWAVKIAGRILGLQLKATLRLNGSTASWSRSRWKLVLVAFMLVMGGYCLYLVLDGLLGFR